MKNKFRFNIIHLIVLAILIRLVIGFFLAKEIALQTGMDECDSGGERVVSEPVTSEIGLNIYGNAPVSRFNMKVEANHIAILPVWVVNMDATWELSGGPPTNQSDLPLHIKDRCTVIINSLTGDVIRVDFPVVE